MLRNAVRTIGLTGALFSSSVLALGLGDMKLYSAVNEPLRAEISLLKVGDLDTNEVLVKLASLQDFERANVDREFFLTGMRYEVELDGRGGGVVRLSTTDPIKEPYLNFLIEAKWPTGRLVREYTLLLDLPAFTSAADTNVGSVSSPQLDPPAAVEALPAPLDEPVEEFSWNDLPAPAPSGPVADAAPAPTPAPIDEPEPFNFPDPAPIDQGDDLGQVQRGWDEDSYTTQKSDTLWQIASRYRPSDAVSVNQTMIAIQRANPDAFIDGNINKLKVGQVLRVPGEPDARGVDRSDAQLEVARQMQEWRTADDDVRQLDARVGAAEQASISRSDNDGTLSLSSVDGSGINGDVDGTADSEVIALNARLTEVLADLSSTSSENDRLNGRVQDLLSEMEDLKNKLEVRNSQLATMQASAESDGTDLTEFDESPDAIVTPEDPDLEFSGDDPLYEEDAIADSDSSNIGEEALDETVDVADDVVDDVPATVAAKEEGWFDSFTSPGWLAAIAAAVLAIFAAIFFMRRRSEDDDEELDEYEDTSASMAPGYDEDPEDNDLASDLHDDDDDDSSIEAEMGDPVAEADIYVAYGRYPQAIELLQRACEQEPQREDLIAKLAEVHEAAGDIDAAEEQRSILASMAAGAVGLAGAAAAGSALADNDEQDADEFDIGVETAADFESDEVDDLGDALSDLDLDLDTDASADGDLDVMDEFRDTLDETDTQIFDSALQEATEAPAGTIELEDTLELDALLEEVPDGDTADDGLDFADEFDLELDLDDSAGPAADTANDIELSAQDVRAAMATGNDLSDTNFSGVEEADSSVSVDALDDDLDLDLDLSSLDDDQPAFSANDPLDDLDLDIGLDSDLDLGATPEQEPVSAEAVPSFELENLSTETLDQDDTAFAAELADLELDLEQTAPAGDDEAQRAADIAMLEADETATKLDLARAYIDMGDISGAQDILTEVMNEGTALDKQQAKELLDRIS